MARPTKLTPEIQKRIAEALHSGNTRKAAAAYGGVSFQTFLNWMEQGEAAKGGQFFEFFDLVTRAEAECEVGNVAVLKKAAMGYMVPKKKTTRLPGDGGITVVEEESFEFDWRAALEWLKRRRREDWGDNVRIDVDDEIARLLATLASGRQAETP